LKTKIFLIFFISSLVISCSSKQDGSMFGDFKSTECTGDNCAVKTPTPEPSFERDDNSDVIVDKFDNTLELSGKCRLKDIPDSEIQIQVTSESGSQRTLTDGFVPIIGITSAANRIAKCEKGRWAIAINACNNFIGVAGAHKIDLVLKGKDKNNRYVDIQDGKITMNLIRSTDCDVSVQ
jgi:hypothetical protein